MWLNQLKIAIVEKDIDTLNILLEDIPQLEKAEDIDSAICLLKEAESLIMNLQNDTEIAMKQMKKNIDYLKSTQENKTASIDIKS